MSEAFPWKSHFTVKESDIIETMRRQVSDGTIIRSIHAQKIKHRSIQEVAEYMLRNPREDQAA